MRERKSIYLCEDDKLLQLTKKKSVHIKCRCRPSISDLPPGSSSWSTFESSRRLIKDISIIKSFSLEKEKEEKEKEVSFERIALNNFFLFHPRSIRFVERILVCEVKDRKKAEEIKYDPLVSIHENVIVGKKKRIEYKHETSKRAV